MPLTNESADVLVVKQPDGNYLVRSKSEEGGIWLVNNVTTTARDYANMAAKRRRVALVLLSGDAARDDGD